MLDMCLRFIQNNEKDLYKCFTLRILKHVLHCLKLLLKKKRFLYRFYSFSSINSTCQVFLNLLSVANALTDCSNDAYNTLSPSLLMHIFSFLLIILPHIFKLDQACFYKSYPFNFCYTLQLSSVTVVSLSFHQLRCKKDNLGRWEDMEWEVRMKKAFSKSFPVFYLVTQPYIKTVLWPWQARKPSSQHSMDSIQQNNKVIA